MTSRKNMVVLGVFLMCVSAARVAAAEDAPTILQLGAGAFDLVGEEADGIVKNRSAAGLAELRFGEKLLHIGPAIGVLANTDGGVYGYGGFYFDLPLGNFAITPLAAVGGYHRGNSKDLGGVLEFRLSITAAYVFAGGSRLGIQFGHMSNAKLHRYNPGQEDAFITYGVAF